MKKKYFVRDQFSVKHDNEVIVGPGYVELTDEEAALHAHKLELADEDNSEVLETNDDQVQVEKPKKVKTKK